MTDFNPTDPMMHVAYLGLGLLVGGLLAWFLGARSGSRRVLGSLSALAKGLKAGNLPDPGRMTVDEAPEVKEIREALVARWVVKSGEDGDDARRAMGRVARYLRRRVEAPLLEGLDGDHNDLREGAEEALGAVEDLEFFLEDPPAPREPEARILGDLVQEVTREFASQSTVLVKVEAPPEPISVQVEAEPVKDAIFLILHNAGEFGGGQPVQVRISMEGGMGSITVRDQGPGFSAEALLRAMDPFYSTSQEGLGLGLPHARRAINAQGGEVHLRNVEGGGGEVEIRIPLRS